MEVIMVDALPELIAGPVVRRLQPEQMVLWFVCSRQVDVVLELYREDGAVESYPLNGSNTEILPIGERAYVYLVNVIPNSRLPLGERFEYDLKFSGDEGTQGLAQLQPTLLYPGESRPSLVIKSRLDKVLHGSCRKPHYPSDDGLLQADLVLQSSVHNAEERPALLLMSGDQIYADDVAGPMLTAIHQVIELLGLQSETLTGATVKDSDELYRNTCCYYQRENLLPHNRANETLRDKFFGGAKKPIFTADGAHNHLITLGEVLAMYLLVWSPSLWAYVKTNVSDVDENYRDRYLEEQKQLAHFAEGLPRVQRAMAHLPVYMIFDDHDVTDDWNLTRGWEDAAYGHPFSRRIIGNALIGYWVCQGWGNAPQHFTDEVIPSVRNYFDTPDNMQQDALIDCLLDFGHWHYTLPTSPKLVVLDTRTHRWWSENSLSKPSGLMDWETMSELQQELIDESAVVIVSPAPIFGVKLIETIQRVFTYFGHALTVDAENWMAHPGSASTLLNIIRHPKTPQNFVILSGDVHYSFVYDVVVRHRKNSPSIWQITCSGMKNEFPSKLLPWLDRINRMLYGSRSPLNWFTKRRHMRIKARRPTEEPNHLHNGSGLGLVYLGPEGQPTSISVLGANGSRTHFPDPKGEQPLVSD
ncbi:MAG: alkaline phosphatase family protein [Oceanospirillaceae bacterium]|nr:alkaline phosphatase family protein [Oceanospirillaceae bacterium]